MKLSLLEHRVARADTVVFLDLPRRWCYVAIAQRGDRWRHLRNAEFMRWIWDFPRMVRGGQARVGSSTRSSTTCRLDEQEQHRVRP
jgi:hypothetical protein